MCNTQIRLLLSSPSNALILIFLLQLGKAANLDTISRMGYGISLTHTHPQLV